MEVALRASRLPTGTWLGRGGDGPSSVVVAKVGIVSIVFATSSLSHFELFNNSSVPYSISHREWK
jgi:hypothetical protein